MNNQMRDWKTNLKESLSRDETAFINNLTGIRSNRVSIDFIATIPLSIKNKKVKISHIANLETLSARDLLVTAFDKKDVQAITKSVLTADLGYRVEKTTGEKIHFSLAPTTEEIRLRIMQRCKDNLEKVKIAFRNSRQQTLKEIKASKLSIDQDKRTKKQIDEIINLWNSKAVKIYEQKITELTI